MKNLMFSAFLALAASILVGGWVVQRIFRSFVAVARSGSILPLYQL